jgi:hypothetical protein
MGPRRFQLRVKELVALDQCDEEWNEKVLGVGIRTDFWERTDTRYQIELEGRNKSYLRVRNDEVIRSNVRVV